LWKQGDTLDLVMDMLTGVHIENVILCAMHAMRFESGVGREG